MVDVFFFPLVLGVALLSRVGVRGLGGLLASRLCDRACPHSGYSISRMHY